MIQVLPSTESSARDASSLDSVANIWNRWKNIHPADPNDIYVRNIFALKIAVRA